MTIFEFISVAVSIVLSLAIVRLLNGLPYLTASPRRYWVHAAWVIGIAVAIPLVWWNMWAYRQREDWVFPEFVLLLLTPLTLNYIAATLIPDAPATIDSWRSHFFRIRRRLCVAMIVVMASFAMNAVFLLQAPFVHPLRLAEGATAALLLVGASSESPRVHGALISFVLCILVTVVSFFFLRPGGWAVS